MIPPTTTRSVLDYMRSSKPKQTIEKVVQVKVGNVYHTTIKKV